MIISKRTGLKLGSKMSDRKINGVVIILGVAFLVFCSFLGASEKTTDTGVGASFDVLMKKPKAPFFAVMKKNSFPQVRSMPCMDEVKNMGKKSKNVLSKEINAELKKMSSFPEQAFDLLQKGNLFVFDALCSDTACQVRAVSILILYKIIRENKLVKFDDLALSDRLFLAQNLVLSKVKRVDGGVEFTSQEAFKVLFENKAKAPADSIGVCKRLVTENALAILVAEIGDQIKKDFGLEQLPFFRFKTTSTLAGVVMLPCFLSFYAYLVFCEKYSIPLVLRCCSESFEQPFNESSTEQKAEMGIKVLDAQKNPVLIFYTGEGNKLMKDDDPILVIDGIAQDPEKLKKLSYSELKWCLLANAAQHGQVGGPFKKYSKFTTEIADQSCYTNLTDLFKEAGCVCSNVLKETYEKSFKDAGSMLKLFNVVHILPSTFGRRFEFIPIPQESMPQIKKRITPLGGGYNVDGYGDYFR